MTTTMNKITMTDTMTTHDRARIDSDHSLGLRRFDGFDGFHGPPPTAPLSPPAAPLKKVRETKVKRETTATTKKKRQREDGGGNFGVVFGGAFVATPPSKTAWCWKVDVLGDRMARHHEEERRMQARRRAKKRLKEEILERRA